ncbi:hypothetical protein DXG01_000337 [Tephrocybe rancida]|nr:hypothetical protein DXG01_000337 [Tephrocybe rancida]
MREHFSDTLRIFFATGEMDRSYGVEEDAVRMVSLGLGSTRDTTIAVEVSSNVDTHIDVVFLDRPAGGPVTIFRTREEAIWFGAWDARMVVDEGHTSYFVAAVISSGIRHEPPNVWSFRVSADGRENYTRLQLSSHLQWLSNIPVFSTEVIQWQSFDGTSLNGIIRYPPGYCTSDEPRPTILFLHGGPYRRDISGE